MGKGKILKALSGFYYVLDGDQIIQCRGRGVFRKQKITPLVGDYVVYQAENDKEGYIMEIRERKNALVRPPIANVDQGILVFSAVEPTLSTVLLDRFLLLLESHEIEPLICFTKMDLLDENQREQIEQIAADYRDIGYHVLLTSSQSQEGMHALKPFLANKISVIAGQSGVGKSTLLNVLKPELELKTARISTYLGRGKHTTRHVELLELEGGLVADTPGFSSLELQHLEAEELSFYFPEMRERQIKCKFRGCLHVNEPGCAVKAALENKTILPSRYEHYVQFLEEMRERKPRY